MKKKVVENLNGYLANVAVSYVKMHNLHWNVVGPQFKPVHEYLETLYDGFAEVLDSVAELLKMADEMPLASMKDYLKVATIKEIEAKDYTVEEVLNIVLEDMEALKTQAEAIRVEADEEDNYSVVNFLEDELENYKKTIWFIKSMLK